MKISPILLCLPLLLDLSCQAPNRETMMPPGLIIDADTGNEMDDLYAIVQALWAKEPCVVALTSAHFNNPQLLTDSLWHGYPTEGIQTMALSQQLNEMVLTGMDRLDLPHPYGCDRMVGYSWGYYEGAPVPESPAVDFIIEQARRASPEAKLAVVILGPATNLAAALLQAPEIAPRVHAYLLGMQYDLAHGAWNKNEFNARNDLNALDLLLSNPDLALTVMPANVSAALTFDHAGSVARLAQYDHPAAQLLRERWAFVNAGESWTMWDLALVQAILHPEWAQTETVSAPPENGARPITAYTAIAADSMEAAFWKAMDENWR